MITTQSAFGKIFVADLVAKTRLMVLGLIDSGGFFAFTNLKKPITCVADMAGLRIRTMTLPTHDAIVSWLGGSPTPLPWAEVCTALQTGVADGQMNPAPVIAFAKFDNVQKYLSITNHVITPYIWTMHPDFYASQTAERQTLINRAFKVAAGSGRAMSPGDRGLGSRSSAAGQKEGGQRGLDPITGQVRRRPARVRALIEKQHGAERTGLRAAPLASIEEEKAQF